MTYHIGLLAQAGLIDAINASSNAGPAWLPLDLTWAGHEFLDAARDSTRWKKATSLMKDKAGGFVLDVLKDLLVSAMRGAVGL